MTERLYTHRSLSVDTRHVDHAAFGLDQVWHTKVGQVENRPGTFRYTVHQTLDVNEILQITLSLVLHFISSHNSSKNTDFLLPKPDPYETLLTPVLAGSYRYLRSYILENSTYGYSVNRVCARLLDMFSMTVRVSAPALV